MTDGPTTDEPGEVPSRSIRRTLADLHRRARGGFKHAAFTECFLIGLVLAGGFGVWLEVYALSKRLFAIGWNVSQLDFGPLRTAVSTFFPAVIGATSLQMVFEDAVKANRGIGVSTLFLLMIMFGIISDREISNSVAFPLGVLSSAASLWIWCVANANSPSFRDAADAPLGELPLDATLQGEADLEELQH